MIDEAVWAELKDLFCDGDEDIEGLTDLVTTFLDETGGEIATLPETLATGERQNVRKVAHGLKSATANMGALQLSELLARLEAWGDNPTGSEAEAAELLARIQETWEEVITELRARLAAEGGEA